jgi:DNA processing protein
VFAVPGEITSSLSAGANALLRLGATPLTCAQDVLESYGLIHRPASAPVVGDAAAAVLERVQESALGADELCRVTGLAAGELAVALTELELAGAVKEEDGVYRAAS